MAEQRDDHGGRDDRDDTGDQGAGRADQPGTADRDADQAQQTVLLPKVSWPTAEPEQRSGGNGRGDRPGDQEHHQRHDSPGEDGRDDRSETTQEIEQVTAGPPAATEPPAGGGKPDRSRDDGRTAESAERDNRQRDSGQHDDGDQDRDGGGTRHRSPRLSYQTLSGPTLFEDRYSGRDLEDRPTSVLPVITDDPAPEQPTAHAKASAPNPPPAAPRRPAPEPHTQPPRKPEPAEEPAEQTQQMQPIHLDYLDDPAGTVLMPAVTDQPPRSGRPDGRDRTGGLDQATTTAQPNLAELTTQVTPVPTSAPPTQQRSQPPPFGPPTQAVPRLPEPGRDGEPARPDGSGRRRLLRRGGLAAAVVFGVFVLLYAVDLALASGELPRGVTAVGIEIGGLSREQAEQRLRGELEPRLGQPVAVRAGTVDAELDPAAARLAVNWKGTLDAAGSQPLNPLTRLRSLFETREIGVVTDADDDALRAQVDALRETTDREPAEGTIRFEGTQPVAVDPQQGQVLDTDGAMAAVVEHWAAGQPVELPVDLTPVRTTPEGVQQAMATIAEPAVAAPVTIHGEGKDATLTPEVIAGALSFEPGNDGGLVPKLDDKAIIKALKPQLKDTEQPGKDAEIVLDGGKPAVKPSEEGRGVDWAQSLAGLPDVLGQTGDRTVDAVYDKQPAKFTTEQANKLGIREVIGEFTTGGFAPDSGVNIRAIANRVNGAIIKPGDSFSLNGYTGRRGIQEGYIEAGIIERGRPGRAVGGGCSQFATTLFNAAYFAGMIDVAHREHSYYVSRYPEAREATVFMNPDGSSVIDVKFRNESPTGALIQTVWTPSNVTVRIWGTKHYEVESVTGGRSNFTSPGTVEIPHDEPCTASSGAQGFSVSNTRIVRDAKTGRELRRDHRTARYNPIPQVVCLPPDSGSPGQSGQGGPAG